MDSSSYSLISSLGVGGGSSGDLNMGHHHLHHHHHHHYTPADHHLHHQHPTMEHSSLHGSLSNLLSTPDAGEEEEEDHHHHHHHHLQQQQQHLQHHQAHHNHLHLTHNSSQQQQQLRHSSSPYGLDLLASPSPLLLDGMSACELMSGGGGGLGAGPALSSDDDDDLQGTLTSFVCADLGAESDTGYTSGVDGYAFAAASSLLEHCGNSDSTDAYCFRQFSLDSSLISGAASDSAAQSPMLSCQSNSSTNINNLNTSNNLGDFSSSISCAHNNNNQSDNLSAITNFSACSYLGGGTIGSNTSSTSSICSAGNSYSDMLQSGSTSTSSSNNDYYNHNLSSNNYYIGGECASPPATSDMTCHQQQQQQQQQHHHSIVMLQQQQQHSHPQGRQHQQSGPGTANTTKRSVLMNLLIDGSDIGAGYTSIAGPPTRAALHSSIN